MHTQELSKCMKFSGSHLKSLILSKNKISDEGIITIIKALCES